jgi:chromosome segregation ATPase
VRVEKENLNRKFLASDQLSQRLQSERADFESTYTNQLHIKQTEIHQLYTDMCQLRTEFDSLSLDNEQLRQVAVEHEKLKSTHEELSQHYETLYQQASDIVSGNQILNSQVATNAQQISQLEDIVDEYQLKVDHLVNCNSELNTQKINLDMKLAEVEAKCERYEYDLRDLEGLKSARDAMEKLQERFRELESELIERNELIEQLNQAKEYLVENNSKLLTNNIKIQLFVESMGLDLEHLDTNASVKEYEFLRNQFKVFYLNRINY